MKWLLALIAVVALACSDASVKQWTTIGSPAHIKCLSAGVVLYEGDSTGKVKSEKDSDGWFFEDALSGKLIRVSGDCLIVN